MLSNAVFAGSRISGASQLAMTNLPETSWLPSTSPPSSPIGYLSLDPSEDDRSMLLALADDLPRVWNHPNASIEIRKRVLRAVLMEIVVTIEGDRLRLVVHWQGGDHTRLEVVKNRIGQNRFKTDKETVQLVRELARVLPDHSIAPVLNRLRIRSARGN